MKSITLSCLFSVLFTLNLSAQKDFAKILTQFSHTEIQPKNIESIIEYHYSSFSMEESPADTIIIHNGDSTKLYLQYKVVITYDKPNERQEKQYEKNGELQATTSYAFDETGHALSMKVDMGDNPGAALMNSENTYQYDDQDRITHIYSDGQEMSRLAYTKEGFLDFMSVDAGFMKMKIASKVQGNERRYDMEADTSSMPIGLGEMLIEKLKTGPIEYGILTHDDKTATYTWYKEDRESKKVTKLSSTTLAKNSNQLLVDQQFDAEGNLSSHKTYTYNGKGETIAIKNVLDGTEKINEFDQDGNMVIEHESYLHHRHTFDSKGNKIMSMSLSGDSDNERISEFLIRKISYR